MKKQISNSEIIFRLAKYEDYDTILKIINNVAIEKSVLKKTKQQLQENVYYVAELDGKIIGTFGIKSWCLELDEIISLVVCPEFRGQGLGTKLIEYCLSELNARRDRANSNKLNLIKETIIFALTTTPQLFEKFNFKKVGIKSFPEKIQGDCCECPRNAGSPFSPLCNEIAMSLKY
jgi:amino-acid N-acetyltransferase